MSFSSLCWLLASFIFSYSISWRISSFFLVCSKKTGCLKFIFLLSDLIFLIPRQPLNRAGDYPPNQSVKRFCLTNVHTFLIKFICFQTSAFSIITQNSLVSPPPLQKDEDFPLLFFLSFPSPVNGAMLKKLSNNFKRSDFYQDK